MEDNKKELTDATLTKYIDAGAIANKVAALLKSKLVNGANVLEICKLGDTLILEETGKIHKKDKNLKKGIAFPTCLSVNNMCGHYSPLDSDAAEGNNITLKTGNVVCLELGVHIDGYVGTCSSTIVVDVEQAQDMAKYKNVAAGYYASEAVLRCLYNEKTSTECSEIFKQVLAEFDVCSPSDIESFELKQFSYGGGSDCKSFILEATRTEEEQKKNKTKSEPVKFETHEVYCVDVCVADKEAEDKTPKMVKSDHRTTVYVKNADSTYNPRLASSRDLLHYIKNTYGSLPFNIRNCPDNSGKNLIAIKELVSNNIVIPFPVYLLKNEGLFASSFKFTAVVTPAGLLKTCAALAPTEVLQHFPLDKFKNKALAELLKTNLKKKK